MTDRTAAPAPGRRTASTARRRPDAVTALAVLVPLLALVAALGVHADAGRTGPVLGGPQQTTLDRATVVCPSGGRSSAGAIASVAGASGPVDVRLGRTGRSVDLTPHTPADVASGAGAAGGDLPIVVTGQGALAPGLLAARFATDQRAAADCRPPQSDQWFTGVGAGAKHDSLLQLVNPDGGKAVVDVVVLGQRGVVDDEGAQQLRGITVNGGQSRTFDLGKTVPRRYDLTLHVTTLRGRVSASVADSFDQLGRGDTGADWLAAQDAPSTDNVLLGLTDGTGQRNLVLSNPGDSEGRATIKLVTEQSVFTPAGTDDVRLPPQSTVRVSLAPLLRAAGPGSGGDSGGGSSGGVDERALGVEVTSTVPATASLLDFVDGDLSRVTPLPQLQAGAAGVALLPDGAKQAFVSGATGPGVVTVSAWDAEGTPLDDVRTAVEAGRGYRIDLPRDAVLVSLQADRTPTTANVVVGPTRSGRGPRDDLGVAVVPLRVPLATGLVPNVRPGLP